MRIRITHDYDDVTPERTIAFQEGAEVTVTRDVGRRVVKAHKGVEIKEPKAKAPGGEG